MVNSNSKIKAILFDMDGVLVDTSYYHYMAWRHALLKIGTDCEELAVQLNEGRNSKEILRVLLEEADYEYPESKWDEVLKDRREWFNRNSQSIVYYSTFSIIKLLRHYGIKTGVVTGSSKEGMEFALKPSMREYFDIIVTSVTGNGLRSKPFGDLYDYAAIELNMLPSECLVIENAPLGIKAAKAAQMRCVALETTLPKKYLSEADWILNDILSLPELMSMEDLW